MNAKTHSVLGPPRNERRNNFISSAKGSFWHSCPGRQSAIKCIIFQHFIWRNKAGQTHLRVSNVLIVLIVFLGCRLVSCLFAICLFCPNVNRVRLFWLLCISALKESVSKGKKVRRLRFGFQRVSRSQLFKLYSKNFNFFLRTDKIYQSLNFCVTTLLFEINNYFCAKFANVSKWWYGDTAISRSTEK
jgi:hypothetical protein